MVAFPLVLFLLAIVLSVLRFTDSDYPFGIFKLFFNVLDTDYEYSINMLFRLTLAYFK